MGTLDGKVAIITGAGGGVGRGIATALAKEGTAVAVIDINGDGAKQTVGLIEAASATGLAITADISDSAAVDSAVADVVDRFGTVDILVNNAQASRSGVPLAEVTDADLDLAFGTGPRACFYFMRACFPYLKDGYGRVINLRSASELLGMAGYATYVSTKGAIGALTRSAAREWGALGITVNCIAPGVMTPGAEAHFKANPDDYKAVVATMSIPRFGDAEGDVGRAAVFLAGPDASYITGTTLSVDGGGAFYA
ncbi:NAD(P)-dependent dehydrogenase (short-subunit alcohol dehydrogenase family) [Actinoplanes lutulentus]|uniref:NAD(P)-dependent dehydrogenase (Short-subunit alcohol dehydrogenase family) n=1 Tax=Actinoplanes lutulentus TaxID=1287878 RepID=A0A327ZA42_9ACTN|nr:SDR family oxidoreductase [Actinoplanes lutulentus]MBB2943342.1 NAD(P)-dependent dehydrogenase (short-subunit alcohol dehydrogenase family) [Actinoplanes lutulentus]RAK28401.1 NAD(P)-dependent dehydrogenase (short-subunit alcohol dehydrogenase family) [Actinoplanes lutulentus]